jgi:hypothetical protein
MDQPLEDLAEIRGAATRKLLKTIIGTLEITDVIAAMMMFATAFSAYATWKTAQVTNEILLTSQRPYVGIESIKFDNVGSANPRVVADLRNFGTVQAENALISIGLRVNGRPLSGGSEQQQQLDPVVLSPSVPHPFYRHIAADTYRDATQGKVHLVVEVRVHYNGPRGDEHCYLTREAYDHIDGIFYPQGGSLSCDHQADTVPAR